MGITLPIPSSENCFNVTAKINGAHVKRLSLVLHSYCYNLLLYCVAFDRCPLCCCGIYGTFFLQTRARPKVMRSKENHMFVLYIFITELALFNCKYVYTIIIRVHTSDTYSSLLTFHYINM